MSNLEKPVGTNPGESDVADALRRIIELDKMVGNIKDFEKTFAHVRLFAMLSVQLEGIAKSLKSIEESLKSKPN